MMHEAELGRPETQLAADPIIGTCNWHLLIPSGSHVKPANRSCIATRIREIENE